MAFASYLNESDLPLAPLLNILADSSYSGDIVVQGHGWQGDITESLRRSKAWYTAFPLQNARAAST
ncbi:MAG: hypothetical protein WCK89_10385 [bacterium]